MHGTEKLFTDHDNHAEELGTMEVNGSCHHLTPSGITELQAIFLSSHWRLSQHSLRHSNRSDAALAY